MTINIRNDTIMITNLINNAVVGTITLAGRILKGGSKSAGPCANRVRIKLWSFLFTVGVILCGCVEGNETPKLSKDMSGVTARNMVQCLLNAAPQIDDGVSDASVVAATMLSICDKEADADALSASAGLTGGALRKFQSGVPGVQLEIATEVVLRGRAARN
jgi:hypothetical protein